MDLGLGLNMIALFRRLALMALLITTTSCLKAPSETDSNGPAVAADEVQKAILTAWDSADFNSIKLNEFLYIEQDQKISTLDPKVVYKEASQIIARTETATTINFKFLIRSQAMENGNFKPVTSYENDIESTKTNPSFTDPLSTAMADGKALPKSVDELQRSMANGSVGVRSGSGINHFLGVLTIQNMLSACVKSENWDVTCHNLRISEGVTSPPTGVSSQQNCGGIPDCQIRYKKIAFDLVVNFTDEDSGSQRTEKVVYEMTISPDVPYLSRLMEFCYQGMVPTASQKVLVKICNRVQNFELGQN